MIGAAPGAGRSTATAPIVFNADPARPAVGVPALGAGPPATRRAPALTVSVEPSGATVMTTACSGSRSIAAGWIDVAGRPDRRPRGHRRRVPSGTSLQLHPDLPNDWDAWDVDAFYRNRRLDLDEADASVVVVDRPDERRSASPGPSAPRRHPARPAARRTAPPRHRHRGRLARDRDQLLKLAFPLDVHADRSVAEIQFGHVARPTHTNTSWEAAKFEICAHRWLHVGEPGYGVALVNDSTYGHDVSRTTRERRRDDDDRSAVAAAGAAVPGPA